MNILTQKLWFVFDVESIGLHGEAFAVGGLVLDVFTQEVHREFLFACDPAMVMGEPSDRKWVRENIPAFRKSRHSLREVRDDFWNVWMECKPQVLMAADVAWPVEAGFLSACVNDDWQERAWNGPFPLLDISSLRAACGTDPTKGGIRLAHELPEHNPLHDARQSGRLLVAALAKLRGRR